MKEYAFGIDLGGTTAKVGLFTTSGALLEKWEVPTDTSNAGEHILENLADAIHAKMAEKEITSEQVEGVGIGVPGPVLDSRVVPIICANLGGWGERNVSAQLSGLLDGMKVLVGNDANVAALGEIWMGTAKGCRSAVMVTLGTGVGGGVIVNGKVIDGAHGAGGEIGHITVNRHETVACGCGKHGCLEQYSSATGVVRCMKKLLDENPDADCVLRGKDFEAKDVFDAARSGDALAAREVDEMADTLAWLWPPLPAPPTRDVPHRRRCGPRRRRPLRPAGGALQDLRLQVLPRDAHQGRKPRQRRRYLRRRAAHCRRIRKSITKEALPLAVPLLLYSFFLQRIFPGQLIPQAVVDALFRQQLVVSARLLDTLCAQHKDSIVVLDGVSRWAMVRVVRPWASFSSSGPQGSRSRCRGRWWPRPE